MSTPGRPKMLPSRRRKNRSLRLSSQEFEAFEKAAKAAGDASWTSWLRNLGRRFSGLDAPTAHDAALKAAFEAGRADMVRELQRHLASLENEP